MKKLLSLAFGLLLVSGMCVGIHASQTIEVPGTTLGFTSDSGTQWNGRWATDDLHGYNYKKQSVACVGNCSYSRVEDENTWKAFVKDLGGYTDKATAYYNYW